MNCCLKFPEIKNQYIHFLLLPNKTIHLFVETEYLNQCSLKKDENGVHFVIPISTPVSFRDLFNSICFRNDNNGKYLIDFESIDYTSTPFEIREMS